MRCYEPYQLFGEMKYVVWRGVCGSCLTEVLKVLVLGGFESHERLSMWKCYYTIGLWAYQLTLCGRVGR